MRFAIATVAAILGLATLTACSAVSGMTTAGSGMTISNESLARKAAGKIGIPENEITISERRTADGYTYYTATARGQAYMCQIYGGGVLMYGVASDATCVKRQD